MQLCSRHGNESAQCLCRPVVGQACGVQLSCRYSNLSKPAMLPVTAEEGMCADPACCCANNAACGSYCQVTEAHGDRLSFDIIMETLRATNLGTLQIGASVNFERSARVGDEIGGHNVSGHVCSTAAVSKIEDSENNRRLTFQVRLPACLSAPQHVLSDGCKRVGEHLGGIPFDCRPLLAGHSLYPCNAPFQACTAAHLSFHEACAQGFCEWCRCPSGGCAMCCPRAS